MFVSVQIHFHFPTFNFIFKQLFHFRVALVDSSAQGVYLSESDIITLALTSAEWIKLLRLKSKQALFSEIHEHIENHKSKQELTNVP